MTVAETCAQPPARKPSEHTYYGMTKSLCSVCKRAVDAKICFADGQVHFHKYCPDHGQQHCLVSSSVDWYLDALSFVSVSDPPAKAATKLSEGCPFDCGPCASHQQRMSLPVVPITSACNLDCPVCYTVNKNQDAFMLSTDDFAAILERITASCTDPDIINFTGGEPTLHPELMKLLQMSREAGIRRLTLSTNGLALRDESYTKQLAELDTRVVLSLDTFDEATDRLLVGANTVQTKLGVLDLLEKHDVTTTILPAVAAGLNDVEVPRLLQLVLDKPNICSLELHTMAFTGQGGSGFDRKARITIPDLHGIIEQATEGRISGRDFVPSPLAHPHCYSICYLLMLDGGAGYVPYSRFVGRETLFDLLGDTIYIEPNQKVEQAMRDGMDALWADPTVLDEADAVLATLKRLLLEMFPSDGALPLQQRTRIAERATKAIYIHSHMDEDSFDVSRVMKCCVAVPESDGSTIPTCSYNVLYRERDTRFADPGKLERMKLTKLRSCAAPTREDAP